MTAHDSAIASSSTPLLRPGPAWGLLGVVAFSFTVPLTRVATTGGLSPLLIGSGRAVVAGLLAALLLLATRRRRPTGPQCARLAVVAGGVVLGFPLLTSYALTTVPASHGAVVVGLLPAATAAVAVLRGQESVPPAFWLAAGLGALAAVAFALVQGSGLDGVHRADILLLGAVLAAAVGYAEGAVVARELGAWPTISWALVLSLPVMAALTVLAWNRATPSATTGAWLAFGYLGVVSMFLGFFAWYRGLAIGPVATVSQVQLVQPVLSIAWAVLLLGEPLGWPTVVGGVAVVLCARLAVRTRLRAPRPLSRGVTVVEPQARTPLERQ